MITYEVDMNIWCLCCTSQSSRILFMKYCTEIIRYFVCIVSQLNITDNLLLSIKRFFLLLKILQ